MAKVINLGVLLLLAVGYCYGQSTVMPEPTPTVAPAVPTETPMMMVQRRYRDETFYRDVYTSNRYNNTESIRKEWFNCHQRNSAGIITNRVPGERVLTIFLHMPALHFLTLEFKRVLMNSVTTVVGINNINDTCIDGHDQAFVGEFAEGIMLRIYDMSGRSNVDMMNSYTASVSSRSSDAFVDTSYGGRGLFYNNTDPTPRAAIPITAWRGRYSINFGGCRQLESSMNRYLGRMLTAAELACTSLTGDQQDDLRESTPENPNPINYYLEAGDIVFAVIGAIAAAAVCGMAILGYCIHPFFLS